MPSNMTRLILVSLPLCGTVAATWASLQQRISEVSFDTPTYRFQIPNLRVGTLNSLLTLGDELAKFGSFVESVAMKVRRQIEDLEKTTSSVSTSLSVHGVPVEIFVTRFGWNLAKYPTETPLKDTTAIIQGAVSKLDEDLKVRASEYSAVKSQLGTTLRKQMGSLSGRDLTTLVRDEDIINTEHMTTLAVVVPKAAQQEWMLNYEKLCDYVVPRSAKNLHEDTDYLIYTVIVFRHVVESFTNAAGLKNFQVRTLTRDPNGGHFAYRAELEHWQEEHGKKRHALLHWCYATFGEVFSAWVHLCAIRIFVESVLRYGLPPAFLAVVLAPRQKNESKVCRMLEHFSGGTMSGSGKFWATEEDPSVASLAGDGIESHPYVSLTLNISSEKLA